FAVGAEAARLKIAQRHARLFARLLVLLSEHGFLKIENSEYVIVKKLALGDALPSSNDLLARYAQVESELDLLNRCGADLARVLQGLQDPLPLLFPEGSFAAVRKIYADSAYSRSYNHLLAWVVQRAGEKSITGKPLRVLEIGGGTGSSTNYILPAL